ncbi:MAG: NAD(P)/FAD-dependent oxidoreductase [Actinobacteria bacterium]|nr:NAD(P)/FAD-dependent oxidoreductase [Actinomycetota bacterium]
MEHIAVVGASLAGLRAVETLRREGFGGRLTLVGGEPHLPYDRPPLSKELLAGSWQHEEIVLRKVPYDELDVELRLGVLAAALDVGERTLTLADGTGLAWDGLVIATGATPRALPGVPTLEGLFTLRTIDDCLALRERLDAGPRVCVIGAGFMGAEVAATCRGRGLDVTVLEALPQPMVRGVGARLGEVLADLHRDHGVDLRCGVTVETIEGDGRVEQVQLAGGATVACDVVLVAIGVTPCAGWLEGSGLTLDDGIVCDETLLAAPGVVAAGDVCRWPNPLFDGESMRIEHWTNAAEQGVAAAQRLLRSGDAPAFAPVPFVWSDQYDVKIQSAGRFSGDGHMEVVHGTLGERRFVALFERTGRLSGVLAFSQPRRLMQYRRMIAERATFADALAFAAENG